MAVMQRDGRQWFGLSIVLDNRLEWGLVESVFDLRTKTDLCSHNKMLKKCINENMNTHYI